MPYDTLIAVFADHIQAEAAVKKLADSKFDMKQLSIVGQGYHTEERVIGFYSAGATESNSGASGAPSGAASGGCFSVAYS
jgi:hypothetical protein